MSVPIADYALIGDCQTAALISRGGSIDWLCFPRFDSPACFAALLGTRDHGLWTLAPVGEIKSCARHYRDDTLILETEWETDSGSATVIDFMPIRTEHPDVVRTVVGKRGEVQMETEITIRFDYGSLIPWVRKEGNGIVAIAGPEVLHLHSGVPLHPKNFHTAGEFTVSRGERVSFVLTWHPSHLTCPRPANAARALSGTEGWWRKWSERCTYKGEWRDAVLRSLITLKGLTYAPTGGIVAAATTSLPEKLGGMRNWDYRFCWVRDATFTLYALLMNGYQEEATAWREWLLRAVAGKASQLNLMYGVTGERRLPELELDWLPGYAESKPVRIGNAAWRQFQLDVFGEVLDSAYVARQAGLQPTSDGWRVGRQLVEYLETVWQEPDEGIWEVRGGRRQFTHSKIMAWVALDRAVKSVREYGLEGPVDRWVALRDRIHAEVCEKAFDSEIGAFVQSYGSKFLDASLLMTPHLGFLPVTDPRMRGTIAAIEKQLLHNGFVRRYSTANDMDGLPPHEGAFLLCTFWLADCYVLLGRRDEARTLFEKLLDIRNDVGLLSEEFDPESRCMLGNFPQAFSHVGLVNTARNLTAEVCPAEHRQQTGTGKAAMTNDEARMTKE